MHYSAAHYFVSGPIHAGTFGPNDLDMTFGPEVRFVKAPPAGADNQNLSPATGYQFFGHVAIKADTGVTTMTLRDTDDNALWSTDLEPKRA